MLSSITPLGQRSRGGSWLRTVVSFILGAAAAGTLVFGGLALIGRGLGFPLAGPLAILLVVAVSAVLELTRIEPVGLRRQVDEDWLGAYRDWVVGFGFGAQLGSGIATIVTTWAVWALLGLAPFLSVTTAILIGLGFSLGRSALLVRSGSIDTAGDLATTMRRFALFEGASRMILMAGYLIVVGVGWLNWQ